MSRTSTTWRAAFGLALAVLPACGDTPAASFRVNIHTSPPVSPTARCPDEPDHVPVRPGPDGATAIRLTFMEERAGVSGILCDAVIPLEGAAKLVGIPHNEGEPPERVDLIAETFRGDPYAGAVLVGSGVARDVATASGLEAEVFVAPRDRFACAARRLHMGRAFHSATTLPNGEVLIVGGVVADPGDPANVVVDITLAGEGNTVGGFFATRSVEIYDPEASAFREVAVPELPARAFHQAYLVPSTGGVYQVWLVGGLTVAGDPATVPVADGVRDHNEPLRLMPGPGASGAPVAILTYDPAQGTITYSTVSEESAYRPRLFDASTRPPSPGDDATVVSQWPPIVAGGWSDHLTPVVEASFELGDAATAASTGVRPTAFPSLRAGATVTRLGADRALLWGGNLGSAASTEVTETGELLGALTTAPAAGGLTVPIAPASLPSPRAFHTATALDATRVLVVGGFALSGGMAFDPVVPFAQLVSLPEGSNQVTLTDLPLDGAAVGYHDAIPLLGGDILVTGGSPASATPDCNYFCALPNAWRWSAAAGMLAASTARLVVPRWGHRSVALRDGTVLLTGGFTWNGALELVRDAEVFNPRTEVMDPAASDPGLASGEIVRAAGDVARALDGTAFSPCSVQSY